MHTGLRPDLRAYNGRFCLPYTDPVGERGTVYVIVPGLQDHSLALLQALYPTGETADGPRPPGSDRPYYRVFTAPAGATPAAGLDVALDATWADGIGLRGVTAEPLTLAPVDNAAATDCPGRRR